MLPKKILLIRLDRIGDLVLTLPVDQSLLPSESKWWVPKGLSFVTSLAVPPRSAVEVAKKISITEFFDLLRFVRQERFDAAVIFQAPWWVSLLLMVAGVKIRAGVKSQWHSFLFLNRAVRQKRSRAEVTELEYNYRLVEEAFGLPANSLKRHTLKLRARPGGEAFIANHGLEKEKYSVVHPGMGGSALNWPTERYAALIEALAPKEKIVITGTAADEPWIAPLRDLLHDHPKVVWLDGKLKGPELIAVLSLARTITAPSTGVLHLAASVGRPTLGLFSPVKVQHPRRWGPQGERVAALVPDVECTGGNSCVATSCKRGDCMARISTEQALETLEKI